MTKVNRILALLVLLSFGGQLQAQTNLGDYDGDQLDDVSVASVDSSAKTTTWIALSAATKQPVYNATFSVPGDAFIAGRFFGESAKTYPGVVYVRDAQKPLEWHIKTPTGGDVMVEFGSPGDMIPNQMDLDCDGITDLVVARTRKTGDLKDFNFWYMRLSSKNFQVYETMFGRAGDKMWVADVDRDGCGELIALRKGFTWYSRKPLGTKMSTVQWGLDGDIPIAPHDLTRDRRPEHIIVRPGANGNMVYVRDGKAPHKTTTFNLGGAGTIPLLGHFLEYLNFAYIDRASSTIVVRKKNGSEISFAYQLPTGNVSIVRPDGTVIAPSQTGAFGVESTTVAAPQLAGGGCVRTGGPTVFKDGPKSGLLWRPVSYNKRYAVISFPVGIKNAIFNSRISVLGRNGNDISGDMVPRDWGHSGGYRAYFIPTTPISTFVQNAPVTVRVAFPDNKTVWCLQVNNPAAVND